MLVKRRPARPAKKEHPTKTALIATVVGMLDDTPVEEITCDAVLDASGISRGSLYYHFADFGELVEHALVFRYARFVDTTVSTLQERLASSESAAGFRQGLVQILQSSHSAEEAANRFERAIPLAAAANSERFRVHLGLEQQRLTDAFTVIVADAQERRWVSSSIDARATAVFLQACGLGRIVDDVAPTPMDPQAWDALLVSVVDRVLSAV
jgi:AcrR family transcriptional regulator